MFVLAGFACSATHDAISFCMANKKPASGAKTTKKPPERFRDAAQNRKARFDYKIGESMEAGLVLVGSEVKSLRSGQASLQDAFAGTYMGELMLFNSYIPEYSKSSGHLQHDPRRMRKLLVSKKQRDKLLGQVKREGITLVPLKIYFNPRGLAKVQLGIAEGKKQYDKRATNKKREFDRDKQRLLKNKG